MYFRTLLLAIIMGAAPVCSAFAAGPAAPLEKQEWSFNGPFGSYDKAALQRGYKIYRDICSACHSMNLLSYRNLEGIGYNESQIKNIAAEYTMIDGPNDEGDMFERAGLPSDRFKAPFANVKAAQYANGGAYPPDFSLIAKARGGGADYLYALLTGYEDHAPHGEELADGQYWNNAFAGHKISMAPPLSDGIVAYEDGSPETLDQYSRDIAHFLTWAADPYMEERKKTGIKVILFLLVFAGVMYSVKKKIWADQH